MGHKVEPGEGRRERKKRETRHRISDIATAMFVERGFDRVTIAEIAEEADVSVNTVYNYFPSKEDLFFDRAEEMIDRPSRVVRERAPGVSAARALLDHYRAEYSDRDHPALRAGYQPFMRCVRETPSLMARVFVMQQRAFARLADTLREEVGAEPDDPMPDLVAHQLVQVSNMLFRQVMVGAVGGRQVDWVPTYALRTLDLFERLVSDELLNYATRKAE
ncbi:helix-turn-helix domain-containing protein [Streptomyces sp. NPDC005438]|uniref:TetR/AcrR family transcriptional regulator n=1 Tax=Streptomyces sp. NPDC005438 TaxID=3156880 RepID=UPI0033BF48CC